MSTSVFQEAQHLLVKYAVTYSTGDKVGRAVLATLGAFAEPGHTNAEGRVDIINGSIRYPLFLNRISTRDSLP